MFEKYFEWIIILVTNNQSLRDLKSYVYIGDIISVPVDKFKVPNFSKGGISTNIFFPFCKVFRVKSPLWSCYIFSFFLANLLFCCNILLAALFPLAYNIFEPGTLDLFYVGEALITILDRAIHCFKTAHNQNVANSFVRINLFETWAAHFLCN